MTTNELLRRVSKIIDELIEADGVLKDIDKAVLVESLSPLIEKYREGLVSLSDDELTQRIEKILLVEVMSGMLSDLTPEQIEAFDDAVKRRALFGKIAISTAPYSSARSLLKYAGTWVGDDLEECFVVDPPPSRVLASRYVRLRRKDFIRRKARYPATQVDRLK